MADDLPSAQRMWELASEAIRFESEPDWERYKIVRDINLEPAEKRFFEACLTPQVYEQAVEDLCSGYDPFERQ